MENFHLGVASVDITPPVGVTLWGYEPRISAFVSHPLRAEALACAGTDGAWILVCADVGAFAAPLTGPLRADIAKLTGLPAGAVMISATHTHSGPHVTDALWCERSELETAYFCELRKKLAEVAFAAWQARAPGELVVGETTAATLASNRRIQKPDGTWTNEWRDPDGKHTGYFDPGVDLLGVRRPDGRLEALLVNYGCHPVAFSSGNLGISADYVGYLKDALEATGQVGTVLFTVAGHGNIDPRHMQAEAEPVREMGERLAAIVAAALPRLTPLAAGGVAAVQEPWKFTTTWDISGRLAIYFPHAGKDKPVRTSVAVLAAGSQALVGLPGEAVSEYRDIFRRTSPFARTMLISVANDFVGYLPTDEILAQGAYEAKMSPVAPIQKALTGCAATALGLAHAIAAKAFLAPPRTVAPPTAAHSLRSRAFQGIPSLAVAPAGRLWATWYAGPTPGEDQNNYVVLATSNDRGGSWTEVLVVDPDGPGPVRAFDPELWLDPQGRLWLFWAQACGHDGTVAGVWAITAENPDQASPRWSAPRRLTDGVMMCKPLVLGSGEWLLPASTWRRTDNSAKAVVSTDRGQTWSVRGGCQVPVEDRSYDEHMLVERRDGSLWMLVRTNYGIGESVSRDQGKTWSPLQPSAIRHTASRFFITRLKSGNLLLVKHGPVGEKTGRELLQAHLSADDGRTWRGGLMLDERQTVSYPDGQQAADGGINIIYDRSRTGDREILLARFNEEDVLAADQASATVSLRLAVSRGGS